MANLTVVPCTRAGATFTLVSATAPASGGDEFVNTGKEVLWVANGSVAPINVTLDIESTVDGAAATDPVVVVTNGTTKIIGPFPTAIYNNSATGRVSFTVSLETTITVGVMQLTAVQ